MALRGFPDFEVCVTLYRLEAGALHTPGTATADRKNHSFTTKLRMMFCIEHPDEF
jgi:hypothetical protein